MPYNIPTALTPLSTGMCYGAKVDLHSAFLSFRMNQEHSKYHGFRGPNGEWYRWERMAWGANSSPMVLQTFTDALGRFVKSRHREVQVYVYLDDFGIFGKFKTHVDAALADLKDTIE